jgi:hypothetical protein
MRIESAGFTAETGGLEEPAVGRRGVAAAKDRRERLALLLAYQMLQRRGIGFLVDMPVRSSYELTDT